VPFRARISIGPTSRVVLLTCTLLAAALLCASTFESASPLLHTPALPWGVLIVLFAVAESSVLHIQLRREARTVSLSEIPLVLGLFLASPMALVFARLIGALAVFIFIRRQPYMKLIFNVGLMSFDGCLAVAVFRALPHSGLGPTAWFATYVTTVICGSMSALVVTTVIGLVEARPTPRDIGLALVSGIPGSAAVCTIGLVGLLAVHADARSWLLLLFIAGIVVAAYRAYAGLSERHLNLERLYQFTQAVSRTPEIDGVLRNVLQQALTIMRSDRAEVVFIGDEQRQALRVSLIPGRELLREEGTADDPVLRAIVAGGTPVLIPRQGRTPHRDWADARGIRDLLAVPLRGDAGVVGALVVADRVGDVRTFDKEDARLLETVAAHAAVALQNSRLVDRLRHEALHDALTGLPNRTYLHRVMAEVLVELKANPTRRAALMIMDLNGFKEVNDTLGHLHGDLLLREVGHRLIEVMGTTNTVARLGGDEFALLLPDCPDSAHAEKIAHDVLAALQVPARVDDVELEVGASIGIALAPIHGLDGGVLLKRADTAMYAAKNSGRGAVVYTTELDEANPARLVLASELRQGLTRDEFLVLGQPQADLLTGEVVGVEALLRWRHPERGLVSPDDFLEVAERTGLLRALTAAVLRESVAACAAWRAQGVELSVSVNLSARSLLDPDLFEDTLAVLALHRLPPRLLTFEITEHSVMSDMVGSGAVLDRLRQAGIRLSVDDFGTGYSSLSYLSQLPVDEVKIDKHFVMGLTSTPRDAAIVRSVIDLGANLGLSVVAEGVEDAETWERLFELGCERGQGFWLGRPMPLADIPSWIQTHGPVPVPAEPGPRLLRAHGGQSAVHQGVPHRRMA
jgi:diguanylate cyclase (GGDEF)-like protein